MTFEEIKENYTKKVKELDIVQDVLVQNNIITTIIQAPPYEDNYRIPIYEAQIKTLRQLESGDELDFRIHNILED